MNTVSQKKPVRKVDTKRIRVQSQYYFVSPSMPMDEPRKRP